MSTAFIDILTARTIAGLPQSTQDWLTTWRSQLVDEVLAATAREIEAIKRDYGISDEGGEA